MLTIRRFQKGDEETLSIMIRRTLREVNYTSPKSELDYLIPHYSPETMVELSETGHPLQKSIIVANLGLFN